MCFYVDADWYAEVVEQTTQTGGKNILCDECRAVIPAGETYHHTHMQEHEECHSCFGDTFDWECPCGAPKDEDDRCTECRCEKPELGEVFDYDCCAECHKFLEAVEAAELEAGCPIQEARPPLGDMVEYISEAGMDEAKKYFRLAKERYPELVASGHLKRLWWNMFSWK